VAVAVERSLAKALTSVSATDIVKSQQEIFSEALMGIFSFLFGKPIDKVPSHIRSNTDKVDSYMRQNHPESVRFGDFTFEYLYTTCEPITQYGDYGSVIYIRIESPVNEFVSALPVDSPDIQESIKSHQLNFQVLPGSISKESTRWLYFNMGKTFLATK
jgi:hypothetical protein